jgi:hypothetical protein
MSISKNIESIGFELECGMNEDELDELRDYATEKGFRDRFRTQSDGSLEGLEKDISDLEITYWSDEIEHLEAFLEKAYRLGAETNDSCGFHIHVRFKNINHAFVFSFKKVWEDFENEYHDEFHKKSKYRRREDLHYCQFGYNEEGIKDQLANHGDRYTKSDSRYAVINLDAVRLYKTLEFRIFPHQDDATEAIETIKWLVKTIEKLIRNFTIRSANVTRRVRTRTTTSFTTEYVLTEENINLDISDSGEDSQIFEIVIDSEPETEELEYDGLENLNG